MPNEIKPVTLAEMSVQAPTDPKSPAEARGRYFNSGNAFNIILDPVPDLVFSDEPVAALADGTETGFIACDISTDLGSTTPATTPLILTRYARINAGDTLAADFNAAGSIWFVIQGSGTTEADGQSITWSTGDLFVLPGGAAATLSAADADAVLWCVTNEPHVAFENTRAVETADSAVDMVHFTAAEIDRQIDKIYDVDVGTAAGIAVVFSSEKQLDRRNITPTMTLAMNTLPPGGSQRGHRHNSVAVALVVEGDDCFSVVDGVRKNWAPWVTTVTPPESFHSHHNDGGKLAKFLIVQDGGLYYHARTMGFSFD